MTGGDRLERFLELSAEITGYTVFDLRGTGQGETHCATVTEVVGEEIIDALFDAFAGARDAAGGEATELARLLRRDVFSDPRLGPVARNIVKMWYVGIWYELPPEWVDAFSVREHNQTFGVSPTAYTEALMWPTVGANPPGAKGPGYASWTGPPRIASLNGHAQSRR